MAPVRACVSIAGSPPSTLFGKSSIAKRPPERLATAFFTRTALTCSGWLSCVAWAHLNVNCAARAGARTNAIDANVAAAPASTSRLDGVMVPQGDHGLALRARLAEERRLRRVVFRRGFVQQFRQLFIEEARDVGGRMHTVANALRDHQTIDPVGREIFH